MWKQVTFTLLSISCFVSSQELKIHLSEESNNERMQDNNIETRVLTVTLDRDSLQPSVIERLSRTSNIVFADFPEMPEFVNAKQFEDILNSLYNEKEDEDKSEEAEEREEDANPRDPNIQINEENILESVEEDKNDNEKNLFNNELQNEERNDDFDSKTPEMNDEKKDRMEENFENKNDEPSIEVDEDEEINIVSTKIKNTEFNQKEQSASEINYPVQTATEEKKETFEEEYKGHDKESEKECTKNRNKNNITSAVESIQRNTIEHEGATESATTATSEEHKNSLLCSSTKVSFISKTRTTLKSSNTGFMKQHNGTVLNLTNVTTVFVEESKTFKISSSFTFAFFVFLMSTFLVIGF